MADQGQNGSGRVPDANSLWPVVDDDDLPLEPLPPAEPRDQQVRPDQVTTHFAFRPQPPDHTRVISRPDLPTQAVPRPPVPPPPFRPTGPWPPPEPPRAAPQRFGPPPGSLFGPQQPEPRYEEQRIGPIPEPPAPPVEKPRRRRTALIVIAALVVVAGAGAGAVFTVPGLSAALGLSGDDPAVEIQPPAPPVQFAPALRAPGEQIPAPTPAGVQAALAGPTADPVLGTLTGTVLDPISGTTLWEQGAGTALVPASTNKLLTAAAALLSISHTEQMVTQVVAGQEPGSVVIIGGGDPTLTSLRVGVQSVYPGAAHLSELVDQVKARGTQVQKVYVDLSRYAGAALEPSWDPRDVQGGYIAPIVPAMLDGGRQDGTKDGSPRSANPAEALAGEFAERIGATVPANAETTAPQGATVLGEVRSAPLVELVDTLLQQSDNVLTETVAREVARAAGEEPSFAGASRATLKVLEQNGFDVSGATLADASGLSGQDRVPARLLAAVLAVAAGPDGKDPRTAKLRPLLGGLPVAGGSGTLSGRYDTPDASVGKGWVRAKTGTLQTPAVNSLAGVVLDADGRLLVFAFMTNGTATNTARPALDVIAATLRQCGCR